MTTKGSFRPLFAALTTALFLFCSASAMAAPPRGSLRYSVIVDKFENKSGVDRDLGDEWATLLTSKLHESGRFIVVAQTDMQLASLKEQLRGASGTTAGGNKTAVRGQMVPAQLLVKGVITSFKEGTADQGGGFNVHGFTIGGAQKKTEIRATMQMIDASTGALVAAHDVVGIAQKRGFSVGRDGGQHANVGQDDNVQQAFEKAIADAIPWMVEQLPAVQWRGSVVRVGKDHVIVNRGLREGVSVGDEFIVGDLDVLRDPDTGEVIEALIHERARVKVVRLTDRTAVCSIVSGTASQIVERMAIKYTSES
jgi:curli biogenesis system outer membrane secretion channel CsgG